MFEHCLYFSSLGTVYFEHCLYFEKLFGISRGRKFKELNFLEIPFVSSFKLIVVQMEKLIVS